MAVETVGFLGIHSGIAHATQSVLSISHNLKVIRVHAERLTAQMVDLHANWDRSTKMFIGEAVS